MATVPQDPPARKDTRGLPEGYDPHMLYEYRFQSLKQDASGLEWYIYKYIPFELIKSFAIAIDPTAPFKVAPGVITPANRKKYRATASVLGIRMAQFTRRQQSYAPDVNYQGIGGCTSSYVKFSKPLVDNYSYELARQDALPDQLEDTTSRTRLMGSKQGTLDLFKGYSNSPRRLVSRKFYITSEFLGAPVPSNDPCIVAGGTYNNRDGGYEFYDSQINGTGATLSEYTHSQLRLSELNYNVGLSQANVVSMLKGWSPNRRDLTLFRSAVELRDLPRSIASLRQTVGDFRKLYVSLTNSPLTRKTIFNLEGAASAVPREYLSYHFGWKQTYKDIMDLLAAPSKLTKKYNFLIERAGKPTTFRVKRQFVSGESGVSGYQYEFLRDEQPLDSTDGAFSRIERTSELRLVINATFDFPPISSPRFRTEKFLERIGVIPRVTDIYNLVPWTWLLDYFSGMGNYIEVIDNFNHDNSVINWGVISCVSKGKLITDFKSMSFHSKRHYAQNLPAGMEDVYRPNRHTSVYEYVCETRRDVATILDVKTTSEPSSLTDYQKSIIGALLLQRTEFSRGKGFKPRS